MNELEIIDDNCELKEDSFLHTLKHKMQFDKETFRKLCNAIRAVGEKDVIISSSARKINFIYGEILKAFLYHFNKEDPYKIKNIPDNYNRTLSQLNSAVEYYFRTRI